MMKILLASDIHTEFKKFERIPPLPSSEEYDVVFLAGDIGMGIQGLEWAENFFPKDKNIHFICGNHEYYREYKEDLWAKLVEFPTDRIFVEEPSIMLNSDTILISATLWSGLSGSENANKNIERYINDFRLIKVHDKRTEYKDMIKWHEKDINTLVVALEGYKAVKNIIVMTHFLPLKECIADHYLQNDPYNLNPYYANDLTTLFQDYPIKLWVYGHTHTPKDFVHTSGTRVVCNPFGYPNENEKIEWKILEI